MTAEVMKTMDNAGEAMRWANTCLKQAAAEITALYAERADLQARLDALLVVVEDFHRSAQPDAVSMNAAIQAAKRVWS
jgi:hypothetical protein